MAIRKGSLTTKKRIMGVCARLFLTQGYQNTTIREIAAEAEVSISSLQNFFHNKEGFLTELVAVMFAGQFEKTRQALTRDLPPVYLYAVETALQLTLVENNPYLRELYLEAYSLPETLELIHQSTTKELIQIFGDRFPEYGESQFYEMEIGSGGLMRGYMARLCDMYFPLERKIQRFLTASLRIYRVSEEEIADVLAYVDSTDLTALSRQLMQQIFATLRLRFEQFGQEQTGREPTEFDNLFPNLMVR